MTIELDKFFRCPNCQSYSLSKSEPNLKEKAISLFIPAFVYECSNCSYRYVDKDIFAIKSRFKKAVYFIVLPILILSFLYFLNIFSDKSEKDEKKTVIKKEEKKIKDVLSEKKKAVDPKVIEKEKVDEGKADNENEKIKVVSEVEKKEEEPEQIDIIKKVDIQYIICGNSKKYGVNWKDVEDGIEIIRITSGGVFDKGGIKKGDILIEVNGIKITNGNRLNLERDKLFAGEIDFVDLTVFRNEKELNYRLIKIDEFKVFDRSVLKVRSSHPINKERKFRWKYTKKSIIISRNIEQRVFISGDFRGIDNWAVDDTIIINGKNYPGIKGGSGYKGRLIDDDRKFAPLDITDIIPVGKQITVKIELANHGKLFGNTDIFIIIK